MKSRTTSGWAILFNWLGERFSGRTDFSLLNATPESAEAIMERLQALLDCYGGGERRRWGVEHNGICLLSDLDQRAHPATRLAGIGLLPQASRQLLRVISG
jgi:hypothetical protein